MKTKIKTPKYVAWLSPESMHNTSKKWLSELEFAKDEQLFFADLVKSYTLQLIDSKHFNESKIIVNELSKFKKETNAFIDTVKKHEKGLNIMVDGINQITLENAYKDEHGKLIIKISDFLTRYRIFKSQLFALVKGVLKEYKQKRLLP
ncbi:hypothetical protein [Algibacter mikhailovii]|uniref:Uncharacterized protein n=1 Tax=Algibacter mikhailovii TaxID=425498 RepID=A0A918R5Y5_9FLAO|nr:hypothetical protein [Algibacter mikhailovii]GGZ87083.1 hypothetical protein GCM10007028_26530 [Algibacter mikhailovii]